MLNNFSLTYEILQASNLKQGLTAIVVGPFLLWVTNEGQIS